MTSIPQILSAPPMSHISPRERALKNVCSRISLASVPLARCITPNWHFSAVDLVHTVITPPCHSYSGALSSQKHPAVGMMVMGCGGTIVTAALRIHT
ncbi:uncharacterized protein N7503_000893 [Penicillium pulvis]|uniref:uncharacterized protein n=1 Tax=Penicillium pulvis TaxID=1562058 RepID=UPI002546B931|nr:uncharacterized protein N7503_000893 [Penicillium pulvis]KAJ5814143.1 hypothetical protein N7503_000893 [Penicillium pulvis]